MVVAFDFHSDLGGSVVPFFSWTLGARVKTALGSQRGGGDENPFDEHGSIGHTKHPRLLRSGGVARSTT